MSGCFPHRGRRGRHIPQLVALVITSAWCLTYVPTVEAARECKWHALEKFTCLQGEQAGMHICENSDPKPQGDLVFWFGGTGQPCECNKPGCRQVPEERAKANSIPTGWSANSTLLPLLASQPAFAQATIVVLPHCTGDLHLGCQMRAPFYGNKIMRNAVRFAKGLSGYPYKRVLVGGDGPIGAAALNSAAFFTQGLPKAKVSFLFTYWAIPDILGEKRPDRWLEGLDKSASHWSPYIHPTCNADYLHSIVMCLYPPTIAAYFYKSMEVASFVAAGASLQRVELGGIEHHQLQDSLVYVGRYPGSRTSTTLDTEQLAAEVGAWWSQPASNQ